jgi:hypothetical protein
VLDNEQLRRRLLDLLGTGTVGRDGSNDGGTPTAEMQDLSSQIITSGYKSY